MAEHIERQEQTNAYGDNRCEECQELGIECPKGYVVHRRVCVANPDHVLVFMIPGCKSAEYEFCPRCGARLLSEGDDELESQPEVD